MGNDRDQGPDLDNEPRWQYGEVEEQEEMAMAWVEGREERRPWEIVSDLRTEIEQLKDTAKMVVDLAEVRDAEHIRVQRFYVEIENKRLATIVDGFKAARVVEVYKCQTGFCPCEYDMTSCRLLREVDEDADSILGDPDQDDVGHGLVPSWCPLKSGPVMLKLKGEDNGIG